MRVQAPQGRYESGYYWVRAYRSWLRELRRRGFDPKLDMWDGENYYQYRFSSVFKNNRLLDINNRREFRRVVSEYIQLIDDLFVLPVDQQEYAAEILSRRHRGDEDYVANDRRYFASSEAFQIAEVIVRQLDDLVTKELKEQADESGSDNVVHKDAEAIGRHLGFAADEFNRASDLRPDSVNQNIEVLGFQVAMVNSVGLTTQDSLDCGAMGSEGIFWAAGRGKWGGAKSYSEVIRGAYQKFIDIEMSLRNAKGRVDRAAYLGKLGLLEDRRDDIYWLLMLADKFQIRSEVAFGREKELLDRLARRIFEDFEDR